MAITAIVQGSLFLPGPGKAPPTSRDVLFDLLLTLPLIWRRRAPFAVMLVILAAATTRPLVGSLGTGGLWWVPLAVAVYTLGLEGQRRSRVAGIAIQPIAAAAREFIFSDPPDIIFLVSELALLITAWFAGDQVRVRRLYVSHLEEQANELELKPAEDARRAVVEERARIARELHDVITHSVTAIAIQAGAARMNFDANQTQALESLSSIEEGSRQALVEMRRLLGLLKTDDDLSLALAPQPTLSRLNVLVDQVRADGIEVDLEVQGEPVGLSPGLDLSAYRVIEEALARARDESSKAYVRVGYGARDIEIEIRYVSSDSDDRTFAGIHERVALFGGDFETGSSRQGEFLVRARLPLAA